MFPCWRLVVCLHHHPGDCQQWKLTVWRWQDLGALGPRLEAVKGPAKGGPLGREELVSELCKDHCGKDSPCALWSPQGQHDLSRGKGGDSAPGREEVSIALSSVGIRLGEPSLVIWGRA